MARRLNNTRGSLTVFVVSHTTLATAHIRFLPCFPDDLSCNPYVLRSLSSIPISLFLVTDSFFSLSTFLFHV